MDVLTQIIAPALVGLFVGVLSGMLGIGGGTLLVPVFKLGFGMPPLMCTATSLFTIIPTSISGAATHIRNRTCIPKLGIAAGIGGALMSPVGVWLASIAPDWATMIAAAVIIAYSAYTMLSKAIKMGKPQNAVAKAGVNKEEKSEVAELPTATWRSTFICFAIGLFAGVMGGFVGVGGGFIMVPLMMQLLNTPMKLTSGTSLIAVMILAVPGVITQAMLGNVNWIAGICVSCGSIPGAIVGSKLMRKVPERALRFIFSGFLFVAATLLVLDQLKTL